MIPAAFGYTRAGSVDEALRILASDGGAKVIAGGQSLLPLMKLRLARRARSSTSGGSPSCAASRKLDDGRLSVGALTTYAELAGLARRSTTGCCGTRCRRSATSRSATWGPSAARSPTRTRRRTCRRRCSRSDAELVLRSARGDAHGRGRRLLPGPVPDGDRATTSCSRQVILPAPLDDAGSAYVVARAAGVRVRARRRRGRRDLGAGAASIAYAGVGVTGVSRAPVPRDRGGGRPRRHRRLRRGHRGGRGPRSSADGPSTRTSTPGSEYRAAMAVVYTRRALEAALARVG